MIHYVVSVAKNTTPACTFQEDVAHSTYSLLSTV